MISRAANGGRDWAAEKGGRNKERQMWHLRISILMSQSSKYDSLTIINYSNRPRRNRFTVTFIRSDRWNEIFACLITKTHSSSRLQMNWLLCFCCSLRLLLISSSCLIRSRSFSLSRFGHLAASGSEACLPELKVQSRIIPIALCYATNRKIFSSSSRRDRVIRMFVKTVGPGGFLSRIGREFWMIIKRSAFCLRRQHQQWWREMWSRNGNSITEHHHHHHSIDRYIDWVLILWKEFFVLLRDNARGFEMKIQLRLVEAEWRNCLATGRFVTKQFLRGESQERRQEEW